MANEINDLKRILLLVLIAIPAIVSVNINCHGKAFHCVNSTHFMICVDLGGGLSTTIDDFVIPCPATTVCHGHNIFECEFPKIEETLPLHVIGVEQQSDISETTLVTNSVTEPTATSDTVSDFNETVLTTARPEEEIVLNAFLIENNKETAVVDKDNTTAISFRTIDSAKEINDKQSNNSNVTTISAIDKNKSFEIDTKNISISDKSKSVDTNTTTVECIILKPITDLDIRTTPLTEDLTSSDTFNNNNNSTADELNVPSQIVPSDISILTSEVNLSSAGPLRHNIATNKQNITTQLMSHNNNIDNVPDSTTAVSSEIPIVNIELRPAFPVNVVRTTNNEIPNQNPINEYITTENVLLVTNTDNNNNNSTADDLNTPSQIVPSDISIFTSKVNVSLVDPARDNIETNIEQNITTQLMSNNNNLDNAPDSTTAISSEIPVVHVELRPAFPVDVVRTTNNEILNPINEYITTESPLFVTNTVHPTHLNEINLNVTESQYVGGTSLQVDVSTSQNNVRTIPPTDVLTSSNSFNNMSNNNNIDNVPDSTTAISSEIPVVHIELRPAFPVDVVRTTNDEILNQNPINEYITTENVLLVTNTDNNNNNSTADDLNTPSQIPNDVSIFTSEVNVSSVDPPRDNIATNIEQNITTQLMSNNKNIDNLPDSTTAIPVVNIELRPAFPVDVVRTTNNEILNQNPINEYITTESPLLVTNTVHPTHINEVNFNETESQYVGSTSSQVDVSTPQNNLRTTPSTNVLTSSNSFNNMSNNNNIDNVPDSTTAISSEIPVVHIELRPAFPVDVVRTTNDEILNQNPINEYITTESPLLVTNTVHPTHLNEVNFKETESQYVGSTSSQVDVSTSQNNVRTTPPKNELTSSNSFNNMSNNNNIDNVPDSTTAISSEIPVVHIELRPAFPVDVVRTTNNEIPNPNPINEYITTESPLLVTNTVHPTHLNEANFNDTESQYVTGMVDMPKPLVETDIVNLKLDKRDFITESLDLPQIFENSTNYIDSYSNILRTSQPTVSVPSNTPPTIRDLLNGPNELSALNNDKVDIIIKEIINTDNTTVHVFADEAANTIAPYSANDNNNNKTMVILTSENNDLNDRDSNNITENFTLTKSDSILDHAVNGVLPSIQITETDKTFIPLADQFNNNVTQTVMRTSPISVLNENLESGIVNLTLDKNEFFRSAPLTENTPHSTANNSNTLRVRANAVLESIPTLKDDGNLAIHQKLKLSVPNNEKVDITKEQTNTNNAIVQVQANEAIKTITTDTSNNNNNKIIKFSTEHEDLNDQKSKNNADINSVNGVIPSIQITEIAKTLVPIVQLNTNTIQNVPNVTPHTVLAPKENLIYATPSSPTDRLENTIRNIPNATPHMVLATEDNSNIATPSIIDLVSEPASVGTDNQPALDNMAGPLRIDQLNATVIPNTRITTMPIDYTSKINKILKQNNGKVDVIEQPITPKAVFNNDVVTIAAVATSGNMSNKIIDQNYMEHGNKTDLILEPEPLESGVPMTTEKGFVLLPVELDSTTMKNVLKVTPHTNVLATEGTSNFDILENPNVQTEAVISERPVLLATKPVSIVPIEINSVKVEPKFTEPNNLTNHVMNNVSEDVVAHKNDFILEPASVNSNTIPNRGSGIITDIVEVKPFINKDVLSITPLNEIIKIASTTISPATADEIITQKSIQQTDKNITEKPIVPIGIATSEVDTANKINSNTEQNSISESKSIDVNHLVAQNRIDHLTSIQISPTDNILTAIEVPSSDSKKIDQVTNLETSYNEKVHSIAEKPTLVATENIAIAASTEPTANDIIAITNDNVVPTTDEAPLQLAVDSNIVDNKKDESLVPIPVHLVPENTTKHLTSTQISPSDVLTTVGVAHTNLSQGQTTNLETSYNVNSIPEKPTLVATENIGITASTVPSTGVEIAMTNDNVVPTTNQVPLLMTKYGNIVDSEKDKSSVPMVPIPIHLVPGNDTEHLISTQISPTDLLTTVGVSYTDSSTIDNITKLEIPYNEKVLNIPEKSILATENMVLTASTQPAADVVIAMTNNNVVPTSDQVPLLMTKHSNLVDTEKDTLSAQISLVRQNSTEYLTSTQISPTDKLTTVGVSHTDPNPGLITNLETTYNEKANSISEKPTLAATENIAIAPSTEPSADVVIAITNDNVVPTTDELPLQLTVNSNIVDNDKDKSLVSIPVHLVPENSTEHLTSTQISPTDILTTVGVSQTNPGPGQVTILEIPYNEKVINIPEKSTLASENMVIKASTEPVADVVIAMTNDNVVPTTDQVPFLMTKHSNIVEKDISSVPIPINLVPENLTSTQISPTDILTTVGVSQTNPSQGQITNLETSASYNLNSVPEKSTPGTGNIGITASPEPSANVVISETNHKVVPTTDQVPLLMTKHSNIVDNEKDKSSGQIYLVGQNNAEQLTSTQISPTDILTIVGVSHTNPSPSQITNLETSYNEKVNNVPDKSTLGTENIGITASTEPSANGVIAMTNDNVVPTKDQVPLQLTVDSNIVGNEKDKSSAQTYLLLQNSTELLTSTQISPTNILTIVDSSQGQITNLEKSTLITKNIGITTSADSSTDSAVAITNGNFVSTTDQVPLLITKHSNIVDTEKDKSSVTIGSTSITAPAMTDEVNTSAAVNIQIITNKTDNGVLNTSSDIHLAEQNSAAVMSSQNNLVAENNTPDLIFKIKLPELYQSVLNSHKDAATINQETEPLNMKTVMETYDGTGNTVALTENTLTVNPYENHKTIDLIQNNKNSLTVDLSKAYSNKLPQTDLNVDFIENTSPVSNRIMITQSVSNVPLHKDTSYNRPSATDKSPSQSPGNTIIKKITQFDCITPDMIHLGTTEASTDKTFAESGKVTNIAAPTVTSKDNIQSTIDLNESNIAQSLQNTVTSSPTVLVSTNYNTASIPSTGQVDTVVVADSVNNKPSQSLNIKTVVKPPIPISDITTSEVKTIDISIGSNNKSSIIDINKKPPSHEISSISSATKTVEDLPSLSRNETAVPTDSVQEIITKHSLKDDFIDSKKTSDNKATVPVKQLHNLDNFKSVSNADMWTSTGQDVGSQTVQFNSASATHAPKFTVTENFSPNNLGNHQIQNTYTNIYSPPREYSQTTVTKSSSSNYYLGSINSPETTHPKINSDAVKTIYSTLTNIPKTVNIQTASTPHYIIKTTSQNQDTSKQFNAPGSFTLTVNSVSSPSMETLTKHSIQNKIEKIISDQKLISVEQNSDKRIPIANPTAFTTNSNTDEGIKIVSTYNTVNSQNTMPSAILQVSSSYPSLSKKYVNTFQIKNPNDLNKLKASITEYMNNVAKTEGVVPVADTKQSTSNIMSTLGLNSINNRNVTYTTTLHSNSFDRVNPTKPTVNYVIKRIVNDIGPKGVVTTNSENVQNIFENGPLNGFTSGSIRPADNLGTVVVYKQSTVNNPLITESQVLSTKVSSIPTTVLSSGKSSFSTLVPFVSTSSDPTHRIVINSNTPMSQSPLLVKLIKNINSQQDFLSRVKKDQSVTADSNIQYFIKSPKPDSMVETMIFTKEKVNEPFLVSEILGGFRRSNDDSSKTSVQNVVDSKKDDTGSITNNNERDTNTKPIKLVDINVADTVKDTESDGEGSKDNVGSVKIEENKPSENISMSKDSAAKPDANIQNKFLPPSPVTSQTNIDNKFIDLKLRREIASTYPTGAIESVASQGNLQTEALKVNENKHNSSDYINNTSNFQKYPVQLNLENQTDNDSVNIVKRNNNTINDNLVDLTSTNHTVTAYVQSYLNKDGKQGNKTGDELRLNERSMLKANTANVQLNASSKVKSTSTDSPPVFNCTARGRFADKKDCRKFYTCIGNLQPIMGTCPNNTVFSEINKQCTRNLSHCVRNNQFRCLLEGRFSDFFKDNIYYICVRNCTNHFTRYKLQCQDGYYLDKETVRCERDEMTSIQSASSVSEVSNDETTTPKPKSEKIKSSSDDFECEKEGNFPYAKDCRKYYVCTKVKDVYRRKIKKCSKDEMYDKKKKKCVDSDSKEC